MSLGTGHLDLILVTIDPVLGILLAKGLNNRRVTRNSVLEKFLIIMVPHGLQGESALSKRVEPHSDLYLSNPPKTASWRAAGPWAWV